MSFSGYLQEFWNFQISSLGTSLFIIPELWTNLTKQLQSVRQLNCNLWMRWQSFIIGFVLWVFEIWTFSSIFPSWVLGNLVQCTENKSDKRTLVCYTIKKKQNLSLLLFRSWAKVFRWVIHAKVSKFKPILVCRTCLSIWKLPFCHLSYQFKWNCLSFNQKLPFIIY